MKAHAFAFPCRQDNRWQRMSAVLAYSCKKHGLEIEIHMMPIPPDMDHDPKVASNHDKLKLWNDVVQAATDPILLLDADMFCQRNPLELAKTVEHVGITWRMEGQEIPLNAGFVFVQPTPEAKAFFRAWVEADDLLRANPGLHLKYRQKWAGMNQSSLGMLIETQSPPLTRLECVDYNLVEPWAGIETAAFVHIKSKAQYHIFSNTREENPFIQAVKSRFLQLESEMQQTITPEYMELNAELHRNFERYGSNSARHLDRVLDLMSRTRCQTVLDYGCGKGSLVDSLKMRKVKVQGYDPAVPEYSATPEPADLVVCTDVLEHIEPECLPAVLADLDRLMGRAGFLLIALRYDSTKTLPDGSNPHKLVMPLDWWVAKLRKFFGMASVRVQAHRPDHHAIIHILKS
jgi:hypothetical protein